LFPVRAYRISSSDAPGRRVLTSAARGPAWFQESPRPIRSGHRGAAGLLPANTLPSYAEAIRLGCDLIEMDVQRTADGVLVLLHDAAVEIAGSRRSVASVTLAEVRQRVSTGIPTLADALDVLGGRAVPLLDLKGTGFEAQLGEAVRQAGVRRAIVCGKPLASLLATAEANPDIATSLTLDGRDLDGLDIAAIATIPTAAVTAQYRRLNADLIAAFHAQGISVIAWTVDDPDAMREVVALGVDGITTNRPDLLAALYPR
jgi:glycerophosphoryl diester phosphodiesterase